MSKHSDGMKELRDIYKKGFFYIDERKYSLLPMPMKKERKIFSFLSMVMNEINTGVPRFIGGDDSEDIAEGYFLGRKFDKTIYPLLSKYTLVDDFKLDTLEDHFEEFKGDYAEYVVKALQVFASPFMREASTASASKAKENRATTLKKPM